MLVERSSPTNVPPGRQSCRLARAKLQKALLKNVNQSYIHLSKRLVGIEHLPNNRVRISFEDGGVDEVDLLVAADGIRSVGHPCTLVDASRRLNFIPDYP